MDGFRDTPSQSIMPSLPPGPSFVLRNLHVIATPPAFTLLTAYAVGRLFDIHLPVWLLVAACLASFPVFVHVRNAWSEVKARRTAAALGARLPVRASRKDIKPSTLR